MSKKNLVLGILAHVDAGKTTLSEAILYKSGAIRSLGRVDHKTAYLDTNAVEQDRGITVFSKEARFSLGEKNVILLDTPGHADFSTEAERTLQVLDYAILIISGADGVQGHTITLWKLLQTYKIPTFIFVNKMDQAGTNSKSMMDELSRELGEGFVAFSEGKPLDFEEVAMCSEDMMDEFLQQEMVFNDKIKKAISQRKVFPVCFGSALKIEGVEEFLKTIEEYTLNNSYAEEFSGRVYKISRDKQGNRQTHIKVTGGILKNKMLIKSGEKEEKVEQIRLYSGKTFESVQAVEAGNICTVLGLSETYSGQSLGSGQLQDSFPVIAPALTYKLILPEGVDPAVAMQKFRQLVEEDPTLNIIWNEKLQEMQVQVMGKLELEILQRIIKERFDMEVSFGNGSVIYKETIEAPVIGIGHFEPLRHYAEVHLLLEPLPRGAGIVTDVMVGEDQLAKNWQRLIDVHLKEREHIGVLTGSPICDIKMTIIAGKAHLKHTEGGDFRQATYRAIRQGLMKAKSLLLEPVYSFKIQVPKENIGRVLSDMQRLGAKCSLPEMKDQNTSVLEGTGPVATLQDYHQEVLAFSKGKGRFTATLAGYDVCHNSQEVIDSFNYNPEVDIENPTGSIFCSKGSGDYIPWDEVGNMAHVESGYHLSEEGMVEKDTPREMQRSKVYTNASAKELEEIFRRTYGESKRDEALRRAQLSRNSRGGKPVETPLPKLIKVDDDKRSEYIIVDGYNVIFAWDEMKALADENLDSAREAFLEIMENYRAYKKVGMVVVFDGYKVSGNTGSKQDYGELEVVYTKEAETADRFIEKAAFEMGRKFKIRVVTSDRPVQMAALGDGAMRTSSREFHAEVLNTSQEIREKLSRQQKTKNRPFEKIF